MRFRNYNPPNGGFSASTHPVQARDTWAAMTWTGWGDNVTHDEFPTREEAQKHIDALAKAARKKRQRHEQSNQSTRRGRMMAIFLLQERRQLWVIAARVFARAQAHCLSKVSGESVWVDTHGKVSTYAELSAGHLNNILRKMRRQGEQDSETYRDLQHESRMRNRRANTEARP